MFGVKAGVGEMGREGEIVNVGGAVGNLRQEPGFSQSGDLTDTVGVLFVGETETTILKY